MRTVCKILIVEDELITRQALRYIIGMQGNSFTIVGEASNGRDALKLIETERPDILISDVVMPIMDGVELAKIVNLKHPQIYTIMLSGHSEFSYVKSAFQYGVADYILKPELEPAVLLEKLHQLAQKQNIYLEQPTADYAKDVLKTLISKKDALNAKNVVLPGNRYCLWCCSLKKLFATGLHNENNAKEIIVDVVKKLLQGIDFFFTYTDDFYLVFLFCYNQGEYKHTVERICAAAKEISENIPTLFWIIGDEYQNYLETRTKFLYISCLADLKFYFNHYTIIFQHDLEEINIHAVFHNKKYFESIRCMDFTAAYSELSSFLFSLKDGNYLREQELKKMFENIVYNTINTLEEMGIDMEGLSARKMEFFAYITNATCPQELADKLQIILETIEEYAIVHRNTEDVLFGRILKHIEDNYSEQITLNHIAEFFHISYSYLSTCFSNFTGYGFNEYLNNIRVESAKKMLTDTDIPLADISEKVGYSDQSYFGKVFKKRTGMNPSAYRKCSVKL